VSAPSPPRICFHAFELNLTSCELFKSGQKVPLPPKAFEVLRALVERPGELVTREELRTRLWAPDTFVEFDDSLNHTVKTLRQALGDSFDHPQFIETLPRHGYRFVASVDGVEVTGPRAVPSPSAKSPWKKKGRYLAAASAVVILILVVGAAVYFVHRTPALTEKDSILLADFVNTTGQPVFDDALKQALAIQLEQSPYLYLVPEQNVRGTLKYMGRSPDEKLTENVAREVCQRENIKAMLVGSIALLGNQYVIGLHAVDCRTGGSLGQEQVTVDAKEKVLPVLGKSATHLRKQLGESLASIQKFDKPIEEATTTSLEALQAFSRGREMLRQGRYPEAISYFQRAIELDPNFAFAYWGLAAVYGNLNEETRSMEYMQKAYALRDRVSERERLHFDMVYHWIVTGDRDKETESHKLFSQSYPRELSPLNNLALSYSQYFGEYEKGIETGSEVMKLSAYVMGAYASVGCGYLGLNRVEDAKRTFEAGLAQNSGAVALRAHLYEVAFLQGDRATMLREREWAAGNVEASVIPGSVAASAAAQQGRLREARELAVEGSETARAHGYRDSGSGYLAEQSLTEAEAGNFTKARELAAASVALSKTRSNLPTVAIALALAGDSTGSQQILDDLTRRFPFDTWINFIYGPSARAAMKGADPQKSLVDLQSAHRYELGFFNRFLPIYVRGLIYLRVGQPAAAAAEFQKIIDHRGSAPVAPEYALAHLGLARAYAMQADTAKARASYQGFLTLWKDADSDVPILKQAKAEYAKLQ
jgi:eukaryotic-like serine/threonine-protein kinase